MMPHDTNERVSFVLEVDADTDDSMPILELHRRRNQDLQLPASKTMKLLQPHQREREREQQHRAHPLRANLWEEEEPIMTSGRAPSTCASCVVTGEDYEDCWEKPKPMADKKTKKKHSLLCNQVLECHMAPHLAKRVPPQWYGFLMNNDIQNELSKLAKHFRRNCGLTCFVKLELPSTSMPDCLLLVYCAIPGFLDSSNFRSVIQRWFVSIWTRYNASLLLAHGELFEATIDDASKSLGVNLRVLPVENTLVLFRKDIEQVVSGLRSALQHGMVVLEFVDGSPCSSTSEFLRRKEECVEEQRPLVLKGRCWNSKVAEAVSTAVAATQEAAAFREAAVAAMAKEAARAKEAASALAAASEAALTAAPVKETGGVARIAALTAAHFNETTFVADGDSIPGKRKREKRKPKVSISEHFVAGEEQMNNHRETALVRLEAANTEMWDVSIPKKKKRPQLVPPVKPLVPLSLQPSDGDKILPATQEGGVTDTPIPKKEKRPRVLAMEEGGVTDTPVPRKKKRKLSSSTSEEVANKKQFHDFCSSAAPQQIPHKRSIAKKQASKHENMPALIAKMNPTTPIKPGTVFPQVSRAGDQARPGMRPSSFEAVNTAVATDLKSKGPSQLSHSVDVRKPPGLPSVQGKAIPKRPRWWGKIMESRQATNDESQGKAPLAVSKNTNRIPHVSGGDGEKACSLQPIAGNGEATMLTSGQPVERKTASKKSHGVSFQEMATTSNEDIKAVLDVVPIQIKEEGLSHEVPPPPPPLLCSEETQQGQGKHFGQGKEKSLDSRIGNNTEQHCSFARDDRVFAKDAHKGTNMYYVGKILDHRVSDGVLQFKVTYLFDSHWDQWVAEDSILKQTKENEIFLEESGLLELSSLSKIPLVSNNLSQEPVQQIAPHSQTVSAGGSQVSGVSSNGNVLSQLSKPPFACGEKVFARDAQGGNNMYFLATILSHQFRDGVWQFKVQGMGWNSKWDQWLPEDSILKWTDKNKHFLEDSALLEPSVQPMQDFASMGQRPVSALPQERLSAESSAEQTTAPSCGDTYELNSATSYLQENQPPFAQNENVFARDAKGGSNMHFAAAVLDHQFSDGVWRFKVHHLGWSSQWDQWLSEDSILKATDKNFKFLQDLDLLEASVPDDFFLSPVGGQRTSQNTGNSQCPILPPPSSMPKYNQSATFQNLPLPPPPGKPSASQPLSITVKEEPLKHVDVQFSTTSHDSHFQNDVFGSTGSDHVSFSTLHQNHGEPAHEKPQQPKSILVKGIQNGRTKKKISFSGSELVRRFDFTLPADQSHILPRDEVPKMIKKSHPKTDPKTDMSEKKQSVYWALETGSFLDVLKLFESGTASDLTSEDLSRMRQSVLSRRGDRDFAMKDVILKVFMLAIEVTRQARAVKRWTSLYIVIEKVEAEFASNDVAEEVQVEMILNRFHGNAPSREQKQVMYQETFQKSNIMIPSPHISQSRVTHNAQVDSRRMVELSLKTKQRSSSQWETVGSANISTQALYVESIRAKRDYTFGRNICSHLEELVCLSPMLRSGKVSFMVHRLEDPNYLENKRRDWVHKLENIIEWICRFNQDLTDAEKNVCSFSVEVPINNSTLLQSAVMLREESTIIKLKHLGAIVSPSVIIQLGEEKENDQYRQRINQLLRD